MTSSPGTWSAGARKRQAPSLRAPSCSSSSSSSSMSSPRERERTTSTRSSAAPKWRSSLSGPNRQKPATAVSVVFAQPEQGARLGSAIDRLPVVSVDDAASMLSESSRKRERLNSNASSYKSRVEPRSDSQLPPPESGDIARKRSKLSTDDAATEAVVLGNGQSVLGMCVQSVSSCYALRGVGIRPETMDTQQLLRMLKPHKKCQKP
ncbi:hypothetical protein K466DRAFT_259071 [Polyporus arcularius HHB13444]|uniref:Uncharacterized protein n=1 Tax=Polyporus arcularius HHB13444 TaxID=1314778 RepID=A0A5C3P3C3_9APHY|nr:hypothetical protein K466DRAFT_259071 [Polyporus arcularius HHB13444]